MNEPTPEQLAKLPKWVKAHIESLTESVGIASALRWTEPVEPDVPPPASSASSAEKLTKGWLPIGTGEYARVEKACSSFLYHGTGQWDKTTTQGSRSLYSTRLLALKALRAQAAMRCARQLWDIDKAIMREEQQAKWDTTKPA